MTRQRGSDETVHPSRPERLLTAREVAEILNVSTAWVLRKAAEDTIPSLRLPGQIRPVRFRWSEIERELEASRRKPSGG